VVVVRRDGVVVVRRWRGAGVGNGGPAAGDGRECFFIFFFFLCREYLWVAHGKERVTPSRRGRPSTPFFAVRHRLRTAKNCVVRRLFPQRTTKFFTG
jgi:hypothetical protein